MTFDECFEALISHEGGYAGLENDPGGKTRYGVTEVVAPFDPLEVSLTLMQARPIHAAIVQPATCLVSRQKSPPLIPKFCGQLCEDPGDALPGGSRTSSAPCGASYFGLLTAPSVRPWARW